MDSLKLTRDVCRICLEHRDKINWDNKVKEFCGISYKDCYYKYMQFVEPDSDCFPTNLCNICANGLKNAHLLFEMALESLNILQNIFHAEESETEDFCSKTSNSSKEISYESFSENYFKDKTHTENDEVICYSPVYELAEDNLETETNNFMQKEINKLLYKEITESFNASLKQQSIDRFKPFETSLELNLQLEIQGARLLKSFGDKNISQPELCESVHQTPKRKRSRNSCATASISGQLNNKLIGTFQRTKNLNRRLSTKKPLKSSPTNEEQTHNSSDHSLLEPSVTKPNKPSGYSFSKQHFTESVLEQLSVTDSNAEEPASEQSAESVLKELFGEDIDIDILSGRRPRKPRELMCQYCSVKVNGSHHLRAHEATHLENRERNIVCPKCGIKLYTKESLHEHKKIHEENRKKYKCEYCEKAFFHSGALNVHRRIHLGLMIKCQLCPKEFYRQIDLDRHLPSHSATSLQTNDISRKKKKYKIQCQYCDKAILTTNWKAHKAAHLNQPQVKCKICDKNFFSRHSCSSHLRKTHHKERCEIEENIHYYVDCSRRMSHLMMKQQESLLTLME